MTVSVTEQIEVLRRIKPEAVDLIEFAEDERVMSIVETWPIAFDETRAHSLGFTSDISYEAAVRAFADELRQAKSTT